MGATTILLVAGDALFATAFWTSGAALHSFQVARPHRLPVISAMSAVCLLSGALFLVHGFLQVTAYYATN